MVYPKNVWMQCCSGTDWKGEIKDKGSQRRGDCLKGGGDKYSQQTMPLQFLEYDLNPLLSSVFYYIVTS